MKEIGCSNFSAEQLDEASRATAIGAHDSQRSDRYSLLHREPERTVLPACQRLGLAFLPYFPLASGLLTGEYEPGNAAPKDSRLALSWTARFTTYENVRIAEALKAFAAARGPHAARARDLLAATAAGGLVDRARDPHARSRFGMRTGILSTSATDRNGCVIRGIEPGTWGTKGGHCVCETGAAIEGAAPASRVPPRRTGPWIVGPGPDKVLRSGCTGRWHRQDSR